MLVAPLWPQKWWFADLLALQVEEFLELPMLWNLLVQPPYEKVTHRAAVCQTLCKFLSSMAAMDEWHGMAVSEVELISVICCVCSSSACTDGTGDNFVRAVSSFALNPYCCRKWSSKRRI